MSQPALASAIQHWVHGEIAIAARAPLLMVSGAQGIGKTTALSTLADPRVVVLGLDDFYHTRQQRRLLAEQVHPLCETRGAPGSHELTLLLRTIDGLQQATATSRVALPRFDKRLDDRVPVSDWGEFVGRPTAIILEGWMLGALADPNAPFDEPVNALEAEQDPKGVWRAWQELELGQHYQSLWTRADAFLHLDAPGFAVVARWRLQQEATIQGVDVDAVSAERCAWVAGFIQHFERITRRMLAGQRVAGTSIRLDADRVVIA
ncbi:MAG: hypothetical protein AAF270_06665 [Pseudomonadota bacterium]